MVKRKLIVFRVDGGTRLGMGHLSRCTVLSRDLRRRVKGLAVQFFTKREPSGIRWLEHNRVSVQTIPNRLQREEEPGWIVSRIPPVSNVLMVIDLLDIPKSYVAAFKTNGYKVVTFENRSSSKRIADATVNTLVEGLKNRVTRFDECGLLFRGPRFRVLHPDYRRRRVRNSARRKKLAIVLTLGGGSEMGFSKVLISGLSKLSDRIRLICIQGPAQAQSRISFDGRSFAKIIVPQPSLAGWLKKADLALTAGGGTLYELAFMGVPAIAFAKRKHQERNIKMFAAEGTALNAGTMRTESVKRALELVSGLLSDERKRFRMSVRGRLLVDGKGTDRVVEIMKTLLKGRNLDCERLG